MWFSVTILILIDGFLQFNDSQLIELFNYGHNPYFNRWFSAIKGKQVVKKSNIKSQSLF